MPKNEAAAFKCGFLQKHKEQWRFYVSVDILWPRTRGALAAMLAQERGQLTVSKFYDIKRRPVSKLD